MKALVIGASGLVGGAVERALERSGIETVGTCRGRCDDRWRPLDVLDARAVARAIDTVAPDIVVLAVEVEGGVDACEDHPDAARRLNVEATRHVAAATAARGATLVYFSTDHVFDGTAGPYAEDAVPRPLSVYGRTKWEAERIVQAASPDHLIVRTTAVFGWERTSPNFAMQVWEHLQAAEPLRVPSDQWCNPTLADYLAEATVRLIQGGSRGVFNVVGKDLIPRSAAAEALARAMLLDPSLILPTPTSELAERAPRPLRAGLTTRKLEQALGTEPLDVAESLKRFRRQWRADTYVGNGARRAPDGGGELKRDILERVRRYYASVHQPGAFVPYRTRVQYAGRVFGEQEMVNLVDSALDFWLTLGSYGDLLEQKLRRFVGAKDFVLVNSGSTANLAAVMTLMSPQLAEPLVPGDEVITPAVTFPTTLTPLVHSGLVPVLVDCELGTYNVDPRLLEEAIGPRTRALMVPHTLGNPCDMDVITDLVTRHRLYLVEDTCDALGATFRGRQVGTFGNLGTVSFFPAHQMTTGEGGGVIVNDARLARIVRSVRDWGRDCWCAPGESNTCGKRFGWTLGDLPVGYDHKFVYSNLGYNFKPTDLQAAVGVAQVDRLPDFLAARRRNFTRLYRGLERYQDLLVLPRLDPRAEPSWFGFPITVRNGVSRLRLVQWLENANIETRQIFGGNILKQPGYRHIRARVHGTLETTDTIMANTFFIGVYPGLTEEMIDFVLERFREFFARRPTDR